MGCPYEAKPLSKRLRLKKIKPHWGSFVDMTLHQRSFLFDFPMWFWWVRRPKRSSSAVTLYSRLKTWRYQGRFNTMATGRHRTGVTEGFQDSNVKNSLLYILGSKCHTKDWHKKTSWEHIHALRIHQLSWMQVFQWHQGWDNVASLAL